MNYAAQTFMSNNDGQPMLYHKGDQQEDQMTASGVIHFLNYGISNITYKNRIARKTLISESLKRLRDLQAKSFEKEQEAYKKLGVGSLEELQSELNKRNELLFLTSEALNKMPFIKKLKPAQTLKALTARLKVEIKEKLRNGKTKEDLLKILKQSIVEDLKKEMNNDNLTADQIYKTPIRLGTSKVTLNFNDKIFSPEVASKIAAAFDLEYDEYGVLHGKVENITVDGGEITETGIVIPEGDNWTYPSPAQMMEDEIWEQFKDKIASYAPRYKDQIIRQMELIGKETFAAKADTINNIKGILGELHTMVLFASFGKQIEPRHVATVRNEKGEEIGIDVLLDKGVGIQVKNYVPYHNQLKQVDEEVHGIIMGRQLKLETFLERIQDGGVSAYDAEAIGLFYATTVYHLKANPRYQSIYDRYKPTENRLKALYATQIDQFMPLQEIKVMTKDGEETARNAFYMIGGEVIPVSKILGIYIMFLEDLENNIKNPNTFTVKLINEYNGPTYKDYYAAAQKTPKGANNPINYTFGGYDNIVSSLKVNLNINLNINYTLEQVLSKVAKL